MRYIVLVGKQLNESKPLEVLRNIKNILSFKKNNLCKNTLANEI